MKRRGVSPHGVGLVLFMGVAGIAHADEGGASFWLPGQFGSLSATLSDPGWSLPVMYYHGRAQAHASRAFPRSGRIAAGLTVRSDLLFLSPTYTLATPVAGGQASIGVSAVIAGAKTVIDGTLTGPNGTQISGIESDERPGVGDLNPAASLKWNYGVHNVMTYVMAGVPTGAYSTTRLANLGLNHWSVDAGGGYTYFDEKKGHEASIVAGVTYNFENPDTQYRNGVSVHVDWAASQFFGENFHAGLAGYVYNQVTGDSGAGARLGDFKSRVAAIGPQAGWFFKVGENKWYANLRAYKEFGARHRPEGWNASFSLAVPLGVPTK